MRAPVKTFERAREFRRALTLPEVLLWEALRGHRLEGLRFRRQHPVGPYVLDFFCANLKLAVEVDGTAHDHPDRSAHDLRREAWLRVRGISILRFAAVEVLDERRRAEVLATIARTATPSTAFGGPPPPLRG